MIHVTQQLHQNEPATSRKITFIFEKKKKTQICQQRGTKQYNSHKHEKSIIQGQQKNCEGAFRVLLMWLKIHNSNGNNPSAVMMLFSICVFLNFFFILFPSQILFVFILFKLLRNAVVVY